jgi:hypothetical protein
MECPARVLFHPGQHLGVLMSAIVVGDGVDQLACRNGALDGDEDADEFLMPVLGYAATQHGAVQHIMGGEKGGAPLRL